MKSTRESEVNSRSASVMGALLTGFAVFCLTSADGWSGGSTPLLSDFGLRNQLMPEQSYRILRMDLDVTGDGNPELLLAKALRQGQMWSVYERFGAQYSYVGEVGFPYWAFMLRTDPVRLVAPCALDDGSRGVATYQIDSSGVRRLSLEDATKPGAPSQEDFVAWRKKAGLRVAAASLDDLERNPSPLWEDELDSKHEPLQGLGGLVGLTVVAP